jgi:UDP-glucose 4-epimerase
MKDVDLVFHLAAQAGVRFSAEHPIKTNSVNAGGTLNVLSAAREAGVKKVIFASSSSVYGSLKTMPASEEHPTEPISIYGASKLACEKYCKIYNDLMGLPVVILRYHTVYGPRQRPDMAIYKWTRSIIDGKPPVIYGDGNQTRDFTFINDIIDGTLRAAEVDGINGEIFNLGAGSSTSVNEVVRLLLQLSGRTDIEPIYENSKPGDVHDTYAKIIKAQKLLGYDPKVRLRDGIKKYLEWLDHATTKLKA